MTNFYLPRTKVSKSCLDALLVDFPALQKHEGHRSLLGYLLFSGQHMRKGTGLWVPVPYQILHLCYGTTEDDTATRIHLSRFSSEVFRLTVTEHDHHKHKCRLVLLNQGLWKYLKLNRDESPPMELKTKLAWTRRSETSYRASIRATAQEAVRPGHVLEQAAGYLNALDARRFVVSPENAANAQRYVASVQGDRGKRLQVILDRWLSQPYMTPIYHEAERSLQLFSSSQLINMPKDLRRTLYPTWMDLDLRHAQLAIAAWAWPLPRLAEALLSGINIWENLLRECNLPSTAKPAIKEVVYCIVYGGNPLKHFDASVLSHNDVRKLLHHSLLQEVVETVEFFKKHFSSYKDGVSVPGVPEPIRPDSPRDISSWLARVSQAVQAVLMAPAFEVIRQRKYADIVLFQFDGVSMRGHDPRNLKAAANAVIKAVNAKCTELGVPTSLQIDS